MMPSNWAHLGGDDYLNLDTVIRAQFCDGSAGLEVTVTTTGTDSEQLCGGEAWAALPLILTFTGAPAEALKAALWRRTKGA